MQNCNQIFLSLPSLNGMSQLPNLSSVVLVFAQSFKEGGQYYYQAKTSFVKSLKALELAVSTR